MVDGLWRCILGEFIEGDGYKRHWLEGALLCVERETLDANANDIK